MRLLTPSEVSLRLTTPWSENALACSEVLAGGRETGQIVTGEVLEASVLWKGCFLLFLTDAIPFEDSLRIYLFDARWHLLDSAKLGAMYTTGAFSALQLAPPNCVRFRFIGDITWELELLDRGVPSLPFSDPKGVSRPFGFTKRFKLHGGPLPETGD
jgi:hypothetical protein